jgi:hypothetical protein
MFLADGPLQPSPTIQHTSHVRMASGPFGRLQCTSTVDVTLLVLLFGMQTVKQVPTPVEVPTPVPVPVSTSPPKHVQLACAAPRLEVFNDCLACVSMQPSKYKLQLFAAAQMLSSCFTGNIFLPLQCQALFVPHLACKNVPLCFQSTA